MGTTAQKAERVLQSIADVQEGINNLGGSLTNQTPFKDFKAQLDNIYNNLPKTSFQEGTSINLGKTLKGKLDFEKVYQEVEYIESTGTQYIDTGVNADSNVNLEMAVQFTPQGQAVYTNSFGAYAKGGTARFHITPESTEVFLNHGNNANTAFFSNKPYTTKFDSLVELKNRTMTTYIDGETIEKTLPQTASDFDAEINFYLFARNTDSTSSVYYAYMRIYGFKMYYNNVLVRDFIPCYRKSDNVIGMYDKANNKFYTNAGTGTFTKGADVGSGFNDIAGFGQSSQDTTQGYNLYYMNYQDDSRTWNNLTIVSTRTGYSIKNTSSQSTAYTLISRYITLPAGTYRMGLKKETTLPYVGLSNTTYNSIVMISRGNKSSATFTLSEETSACLTLSVTNGETYNEENEVMIYSGTTVKDFEPYTGGQASPNPSYPQEIKYVRGKNLFNVLTQSVNQYPNSSGTLVENTSWNTSQPIEVAPNTSYILSTEETTTYSSSLTITQYKADNTFISRTQTTGTNEQTITTDATVGYVRISYRNDRFSGNKIMFAKGSTSTPYLPYNTIEEVVGGINKLPWGTITGNTTTEYHFNPPLKAGTYSFLFNAYNPNGGKAMDFYDSNNTNIKNLYIPKHEEATDQFTKITSSTDISWCRIYSGSADDVIDEMMFVEGDYTQSTMPPYEPYKTPTTYQFNLGNKQLYDECYIVGSPDNWKFVDNYYKEKISIIDRQGANASGKFRFVLGITYNAKETPNSSVADIYSNILTKNSANNNYLRNNSIAINDAGQILIYWEDWAEYSIQEMQNYFTNRDDYIVYPLATPIETPITDETLISQLNVWYNAHSNNDTTIITSNGDLPMIIKVRGLKDQIYINNQQKSITLTTNTTSNIQPDSEYDGLSKVTVTTNVPVIDFEITNPLSNNITNYGYMCDFVDFNRDKFAYELLQAMLSYGASITPSFLIKIKQGNNAYLMTAQVTNSAASGKPLFSIQKLHAQDAGNTHSFDLRWYVDPEEGEDIPVFENITGFNINS